ncbi:MAG: response regulator [Deltaproteobacteria bacterium]|nr:response regulator [Deltaproteobacteria bacterium]
MKRVLIAEDDLTSREILKVLLAKWGYEVSAAKNGLEAWEILKKPGAPNLLIFDWMMPELDGPDLCRRLAKRRNKNPVYIILLTALTDKEKIVEGLDAGANDYICKPFDHNELRARIEVGRRMIELEESLAKRNHELQEALDNVKTLEGILPICMYCKKIRNDNEAWEKIDSYLVENTNVGLSHSLCPECLEKHYPEE